jgi:hypothetical protein
VSAGTSPSVKLNVPAFRYFRGRIGLSCAPVNQAIWS